MNEDYSDLGTPVEDYSDLGTPATGPQPVSQDELVRQAKEQERQHPGMGKFPESTYQKVVGALPWNLPGEVGAMAQAAISGETPPPFGATSENVTRNIVSGASGGLINALTAAATRSTPESLKMMQMEAPNPLQEALGQATGAAMTLGMGGSANVPKTAAQLIGQTTRGGAIYGSVTGAAAPVEEKGIGATAKEIQSGSEQGAAIGAAIGLAGGLIPQAAKPVLRRIMDWYNIRQARRLGVPLIAEGSVKSYVKALEPRKHALNPKAAILAERETRSALERVGPQIPIVEKAANVKFNTAENMENGAHHALGEIWSELDSRLQQPVTITLDPVADEFEKVANDATVKMMFPDVSKNILQTASNYRGKTVDARTAETINQTFNAINDVVYNKLGGDRAALMKAHPEYRAGMNASSALRTQLNTTFDNLASQQTGPGNIPFSELKKDYAAWNTIREHAQKQANKQRMAETKISQIESLALYDIIRDVASEEGIKPVKIAQKYIGSKIIGKLNTPDVRFMKARIGLRTAPPGQSVY